MGEISGCFFVQLIGKSTQALATHFDYTSFCVQIFLGGLGACPQEILKNRHQEMQSGDISAPKQLASMIIIYSGNTYKFMIKKIKN